MPTIRNIQGPDGKLYPFQIPDGATPAQIQEAAQAASEHLAEKDAGDTAAASALGLAGSGGFVGDSGIGRMASGALKGVGRAWGGLGRLEMEGLEAIGLPADLGLSKIGIGKPVESSDVPTAQKVVESKLPESGGVAGGVGEILGEGAPFALAGGSITGGIVGGISGIDAGTGKGSDELVDRLIGGLTGGALGVAGHAFGRIAGKVLNIRGIEDQISAIREEANKVSPRMMGANKMTTEQLERLQTKHSDLSKAALDEGDKIGWIEADKVRDVARNAFATAKAAGANKEATDALSSASRFLSGDKMRPLDVVVGGERFSYDAGTGKYSNKAGELPDVIAQAAAGRSGEVKYSDLRFAQDRLARYIKENPDEKGSWMKTVREAKAAIDERVGEVQTPGAKAMERKASQFYDKNIGDFYDNKKVRDIMSTPDKAERTLALVDLARGKDVEAAKKAAVIIGKRGQEEVSRSMMQEALSAAIDGKKVDPLKFMHYFDDKPGFTPFKSDQFDEMMKGFSKYIKSGDLEKSAERKMHIAGRFRDVAAGTTFGMGMLNTLIHGNWEHAGIGLFGAGVEEAGSWILNKLMTDTNGRHLLVAMSRIPENSPRWQRLVAQVNSRYGGAVAGAVGQTESSEH